MGYAEKVLQPGETLVYRARLHGILLVPGALAVGLAIALAVGAEVVGRREARLALFALAAIVLAFGAVRLAAAWLRRLSTEIIVSSRRIIVKTGLVSRHALEMNLDKIESVQINQGVAGRLLDYGTVTVRGVGAGLEPMRLVAAPLELQKHLSSSR